MGNKELKLEFKNWEFDDIVVELAKHIEKGYHLATWNTSYNHREFYVEVTMVPREHCQKGRGGRMVKKCIYPKTKRVSCVGKLIQITEKLDGSNLCFFKKDDVLYIAQRNTIIGFDEIEECSKLLYKGLHSWLKEHEAELHKIRNNSVVCGEWLGMGKLKYTVDEFDKRFYMFAKANVDEDFKLYNIQYDHELFIYPFEDCEIPNCIGVVPVVAEVHYLPDKDHLDRLYDKYLEKVDRNVEGFVVNFNNHIEKYVRMKNGVIQEHKDKGE